MQWLTYKSHNAQDAHSSSRIQQDQLPRTTPLLIVRFFRYIIFELSVLLIYDLPFLYNLEDVSIFYSKSCIQMLWTSKVLTERNDRFQFIIADSSSID